jgi:hypothetical protein
MPKKPNKTELMTYTERADKSALAVQVKLLKEGGEKAAQAIARTKDGSAALLAAARLWREAGIAFRDARGKQMTFDESNANWFAGVKQHLPEKFTLVQMLAAVQIARMLPEPPRELRDCKDAIPVMLSAAKQLELILHRDAPQIAHPSNPFSQSCEGFKRTMDQVEKLLQDRPMENWERVALEDFVRIGKPVAEVVRRAEALLQN